MDKIKTILELIEVEKITTSFMTPPIIASLVEYPERDKHNHSSLRLVSFGGGFTEVGALKRAIKAFGNIFSQIYGLTEVTTIAYFYPEEMVLDGTIDFAFSFDSLVHAEEDVMRAYVDHLAAKLKPDGVAFLHHCNTGQYRRYFAVMRGIPGLRRLLWRLGNVGNTHWRAQSMTAGKLRAFAQAAGLQVIGQELVNWRTAMLTDCFSTFTPVGSVWARPNRLIKNRHFMQEARRVARLAAPYPDRRAA